MTAKNASLENGNIVIRDERGVIRLTSNRYEDRQAPFDVNGVRLAGIQRLIKHRYSGPCDRDGDAPKYLSAAFNAIALGLQLKQRKASISHFKNWAAKWCPAADPDMVGELAARVIARPRRMKATTIGKLLELSSSEHAALEIKAIYPADDAAFESRKKKEKAVKDRDAKERKRRESGCQPLAEIIKNSDKSFCLRHGISERTLRYHKQKGPDALAKFLAKKGITEKLPLDGASLDESNPLMKRHGPASFGSNTGGGHKAPPTDVEDLVTHIGSATCEQDQAGAAQRPAPSGRKSNIVNFRPVLNDPARREKMARLMDLAASAFQTPRRAGGAR